MAPHRAGGVAGASPAPYRRCSAREMEQVMAAAIEEVNPGGASRILLLCDHATNVVPPEVDGGDLGIPPEDMARHIAYDIGARGVTRRARRPARRAGAAHPLLAAGHRPEPRRGRPDAGDAPLRRHDHPGQPRASTPAEVRAPARRLPPALPPGASSADRRDGARGTRAGAGLDPLLHSAAPRARRRGRGTSASSGTATAASPCR